MNEISRAAYSPGEAAKYLGVSRRMVYDLLDQGELASVKIGSRRLIRVGELDRFLAERERTAPKKPNGGAAA